MLHADAVDRPPLTRNPTAVAVIILVVFAGLVLAGVGRGGMGAGMAGFLLKVAAPNALIALALGAIVVGVDRLPFRGQVIATWVGGLALVLAFFVSFNLSFGFIERKLWVLISIGLVNTIVISVASIALASVLAMAGALAKLSSNGVAVGIATFYTSLFRGVPLLMQIYLIYLGLPQVGVIVDAIPAGIIALSLCYGAYMTEVFRAGIESVPRGQWEAARALGFSDRDIFSRIILPQAMRVIIPPTGNQFIAMLKDSSLVSVIGVWELMYLARTEGQTEFRHIEMMMTASLIYWAFSMALEAMQARIERRFARQAGR